MLDFRAQSIPYAGLEFAGSKRKKQNPNSAIVSDFGLEIIKEGN